MVAPMKGNNLRVGIQRKLLSQSCSPPATWASVPVAVLLGETHGELKPVQVPGRPEEPDLDQSQAAALDLVKASDQGEESAVTVFSDFDAEPLFPFFSDAISKVPDYERAIMRETSSVNGCTPPSHPDRDRRHPMLTSPLVARDQIHVEQSHCPNSVTSSRVRSSLPPNWCAWRAGRRRAASTLLSFRTAIIPGRIGKGIVHSSGACSVLSLTAPAS